MGAHVVKKARLTLSLAPCRYAGLSEVRTIPGRKNIAFVEFTDEAASGVARDALHNTKFGEGDNALKLKVTFAKKG